MCIYIKHIHVYFRMRSLIAYLHTCNMYEAQEDAIHMTYTLPVFSVHFPCLHALRPLCLEYLRQIH